MGPQAQVCAPGQSGTAARQLGEVEEAVGVGVLLEQGDPPLGRQLAELVAEDDVGRGGGRVQDDDVGELVEVVAEHAHDGGDAAAGGEEQDTLGAGVGQDEVALGLVELNIVPGSARRTRWLLTFPSGMALTVTLMQPSGRGGAGQGVGAPLADAVDVDADADVLARHVPEPSPAGADHQGRGVGGLAPDASMRPRRSAPDRSGVDRSR